MSSLNKVFLIGRLTRDPEMRYTANGATVTSFSIATNRYAVNANGERKEFTDYHNIVAWNIGKRNLADFCGQYLKKGNLVFVEGRLQTRTWEGQDGIKRRQTEIVANNVQFLEPRTQRSDAEPIPPFVGDELTEEIDVNPDDIPF